MQKQLVEESRERIAKKLGEDVQTVIAPLERFYLAEDYHQKYYLRHQPLLIATFDSYSLQELVDSTVAARLNGYAGGYGGRDQLAKEIDDLGLAPRARQELEAIVRTTRGRGVFA